MNKLGPKYYLIFICSLLSACGKDDAEVPKSEVGAETSTIIGDVILFDMSNNESTEFEGTTIKLFKEDNLIRESALTSKGAYSFENLELGIYKMVTEKDGYGTYDTIQIKNTLKIDTLSTLKLLEFPTVEPTIVLFEYQDGTFGEAIHLYFKNDDWLLVGKEYYFSKSSNVSFQNYDYRVGSGSYRGGNNESSIPYNGYIPDYPPSTWSSSGVRLENEGFRSGEKIYVKVYMIHENFYGSVEGADKNFEVVTHIRKHGSNVFEFQF